MTHRSHCTIGLGGNDRIGQHFRIEDAVRIEQKHCHGESGAACALLLIKDNLETAIPTSQNPSLASKCLKRRISPGGRTTFVVVVKRQNKVAPPPFCHRYFLFNLNKSGFSIIRALGKHLDRTRTSFDHPVPSQLCGATGSVTIDTYYQ